MTMVKQMKTKKRIQNKKISKDKNRRRSQRSQGKKMRISKDQNRKSKKNEDPVSYDFKSLLLVCYYNIFNYDCRVYTLC